MTFTFKLEQLDGTPADPPSFETTVLRWQPGDTLPLSATRTLQPFAFATTTNRPSWSLRICLNRRVQRRLKLRRRMACVGNSVPFSDHSTLQPTRQLTHTAAAIQGSENNTPSTRPMRSAGIATESVGRRERRCKDLPRRTGYGQKASRAEA